MAKYSGVTNRVIGPVDTPLPEIHAVLSHLATDLWVSASTRNQALSALLFLYRELL